MTPTSSVPDAAESPAAGAREALPRPLPAAAGRPLDWRVGGLLLGLLSTVAVALQGPLGVSSAYVATDAAALEAAAPGATAGNEYLAAAKPLLSPEWFVVAGLALGALGSALLFRSRRRVDVPEVWRERFGGRRAVRFGAAFAAGFLLLFGARLAGGCTSGHVISGLGQLALSGAVFAAAVFAAGIPVALAVYGGRRNR